MPQPCSICTHPDRTAIDDAIVSGTPGRRVAITYGLGKDAPRRHRAHITPALLAVLEQRKLAGPTAAVDRLEDLHRRASALLDVAESKGDVRNAAAVIGQLRGIVELLAKLTGELDERPQVQILNVSTSAEWLQIQQLLTVALTPYPEAAQAVASSLLELEP